MSKNRGEGRTTKEVGTRMRLKEKLGDWNITASKSATMAILLLEKERYIIQELQKRMAPTRSIQIRLPHKKRKKYILQIHIIGKHTRATCKCSTGRCNGYRRRVENVRTTTNNADNKNKDQEKKHSKNT
jgi:hypothetical protein